MLFCSLEFLKLLAVVFTLYWVVPWQRVRVWILLVASFWVYASWNRELALLIGLSTAGDFLVALGLESSRALRWRRALLGLSLAGNLGLLCYFKYANFFLRSLEEALQLAGASASLPVLRVILPVGISFYTFEAINYTVDVYRRRIKAERSLPNFMLFILFFPHLIAGPIVRAGDFLPQIRRPKRWSDYRLLLGVSLCLLGVIKKLAVADRMALYADPIFADPTAYRSSTLWLAVIAYTLQIYCDFSGYSDMALGTAHLFGYRLAVNFDMPYLSANVSEFWRRWHISLSTWLRDYLFIPLGGSRGTGWQVNRNLMLTMALGGLWHGASWTFVVWGIYHGLLLIGHRLFRGWCQTRPLLDAALQSSPGTVIRVAATILGVAVGWVFFRASSFDCAWTMLRRLFEPCGGLREPLHASGLLYTVLVVALAHTLGRNGTWRRMSARLPAPLLGVSYAVALVFALLLAPDSGKLFIYFQF
jgi:alginate O-acetyltransferase complex protein AlgI